MKRLNILLPLLIVLATYSISLKAETKNITRPEVQAPQKLHYESVPMPQPMKDKIQQNSFTGGSDFWCIFPPNDPNASLIGLSIFVGSADKKNTRVIIENNGNIVGSATIEKEFDCVSFTNLSGASNPQPLGNNDWANFQLPCPTTMDDPNYEYETFDNYSWHVYAEDEDGYPAEIYVYVASFRSPSSDGYMVLPTDALGNKYVHCSYLDDTGTTAVDAPPHFRTGFTCIAVQDNTTIEVKLIANNDFCISMSGKIPGKTYTSASLMKGQMWSIANGDARVNPGGKNTSCDFSGSILSSDKNFALVSWQQRTTIPPKGSSRDNLVEQLLPTSKWGRTHESLYLKGSYRPRYEGGQGEWPGDIFRVFASQENTTGRAKWYNPEIPTIPWGEWPIELTAVGEYAQYPKYLVPGTTQTSVFGIAGACVWNFDKPVQILQYSAQAQYFYTGGFDTDPLMILVPPTEQWGNNTTFVTGSFGGGNEEHIVNLYAEGPVNEDGSPNNNPVEIENTLRSITVRSNGVTKTVLDVVPPFINQRIPETKFYYASWKLEQNTVYRIDGKTRLSGSVYGFTGVNSYGWPTSMKLVHTNIFDALPPETKHSIECDRPYRYDAEGRILIISEWIDTTDIDGGQWEDSQVDGGIEREPRKIYDSTNNISLLNYHFLYDAGGDSIPPTPYWSSGSGPYRRGQSVYTINDPFTDVYAIIEYVDLAGNISYDTIIYIADNLIFVDNEAAGHNEISEIDFGVGTVGECYTDTIHIKNIDTHDVVVNVVELFMRLGDKFEFETKSGATEFTLGPEQISEEIYVIYCPEDASNVSDILYANTTCLFFSINIYAGAGFATINVTDHNFGQIFNGDGSQAATDIYITNNGTKELIITGYYFDDIANLNVPNSGPFSYSEPPGASFANGNRYPTVDNPWTIQPGQTARKQVRDVRFACTGDLGIHTARLYFVSNAAEPPIATIYKPYSELTGECISVGPVTGNYNWGDKRVLTRTSGTVWITNTGTTAFAITGLSGIEWKKDNLGNILYNRDSSYYIQNLKSYENVVVEPEDTLFIPVFFNPQSEREPFGTQPIKDSLYYNFEPVPGIDLNNNYYSVLEGYGFLPKIEATDYTWTDPVPVTKPSPVTGKITITNTSETRELTIKSIRLLQTDQYLDFEAIDPTTNNPVFNENWSDLDLSTLSPIQMGFSKTIDVIFTPQNTAPPTRVAYVVIGSDAAVADNPSDDPTPTVYDTVKLEAVTFDEGLSVTGYDYGTITRCDEPIGQINIMNTSTTLDMIVYDIEVEPTYSHLFTLLTDANISIPYNTAGTANEDFEYQFTPCEWVDIDGKPLEGKITAKVNVYTNMGDTTVELEATPVIIPVTVSLSTIENKLPGEVIDFPVNIAIDITNQAFYNFANANITDVTIVLNVPFNAVQIAGCDGNGWSWTYSQDKDNNTITLSGRGNALTGAGLLAMPKLRLLLSELTTIDVTIASVTFNGRECCIRPTYTPGSISYDVCAQEIRGNVIFSGEPFALNQVSPNPFTAKVLPINYSIGFDVDNTSILIYNSQGDIVKTVVNEFVKGGKYTKDVDVSDLSSGAYRIIMKSGPFETTQSLIILR